MFGTARTREQVNVILSVLVREGALVSFRTNFEDQGPVWVPAVTIHPAEGADLAAVLERVEKALRPLGVSEIVVEGLAQGASEMPDAAPVIKVGQCYLTSNGQVARVLEVSADGRLRYEFRSPVIGVAFWTPAVTNLQSFSRLVEREIPCDLALETNE